MHGFKWYPAGYLYALNTVVALVVAFFPGLHVTHTQTAAITTIATAVLAVVTALMTRPPAVPVIAGALGTMLVAAGAFGLHLTDGQTATLVAFVSLAVAFFTHQNVTPKAGSPTGTPLAYPVGRAAAGRGL